MKNKLKISFALQEARQKSVAMVLCMVCAFFFFSCQRVNEAQMQSLQGTNWKLTGIVEVETGNLKTLKPQNCSDVVEELGGLVNHECEMAIEHCYTLSFSAKNNLTAYTCGNESKGIYDHNMHIDFHVTTTVKEYWSDGELFIKLLSSVQSFSLKKSELRMYFNDNENYLLFKKWRKS